MKFSIVIPTRNRASYLTHAVRSALSQTFQDYEVIVSNNNSIDDTEAALRRLDSPRIKYFRTSRDLSMVDHWEFALGKASGEWVLFLCDDNALLPNCLSILDSLTTEHSSIPVFQYASIRYIYDDGHEGGGNILRYKPAPPSPCDIVDSAGHLAAVFSSMSSDMPKFLNAAVRMDLVRAVNDRCGRVFRKWAPDYSAGVQLLANTAQFGRTRMPILVWGKKIRSNGSGSIVNPQHLLEFLRQFDDFDGRFAHSPYPDLISVHNMVVDTLYRAKAAIGAEGKHLDIDPRILRQTLLEDIEAYLQQGHDSYRKHFEIIDRDLREMPSSLSIRTRNLRRRAARNVRRFYMKLAGTHRRDRMIDGKGEDTQFTNIYEAAKYVWRNQV